MRWMVGLALDELPSHNPQLENVPEKSPIVAKEAMQPFLIHVDCVLNGQGQLCCDRLCPRLTKASVNQDEDATATSQHRGDHWKTRDVTHLAIHSSPTLDDG
jgi:hypothetical protein